MKNLRERFDDIQLADTYQRVDDCHILDLYIGKDLGNKKIIFIISEEEPTVVYSSQIISVKKRVRKDNRWVLSFTLEEEKFAELFLHFCDDIIEASRTISSKSNGATFLPNRYIKWQNMLAKSKNGLLTEPQVKGLIGELFFLKTFLFAEYGKEKALNSWIGPDMADQDFVIDETWYEVKSVVSGAQSVKISSIEQLDTHLEGSLVIIYLDKTSFQDSNKITLNAFVQDVANELENIDLIQKLYDILLNLGYCQRREYDEYLYSYSKKEVYLVNKDFPSLRKNILPHEIVTAKYEVSISCINRFLTKEV